MNQTISQQKENGPSRISPSMVPTLAGAISGVTSRFFVAPLDVLKIRFQLQRQIVYRGILNSMSVIASQEGIKSLWKGNLSGELLWMFYSAQSFYVYEKSSSILSSPKFGLENNPGTRDLICGGIAGFSATVGSYPLDLVRTRLVAQHETQRVYRHITEAFVRIYSEGGVLRFYSGVFPTVMAMIPYTAIQFATYKKMNRLISSDSQQIHAFQPLVTGIASSITAKVACLPFDIAKKRLQVSNFSYGTEIHSYEGLICCVRQILQFEGLTAFYKGGTVSILKTGIGGGLSFMFYELAKQRLTNYAY